MSSAQEGAMFGFSLEEESNTPLHEAILNCDYEQLVELINTADEMQLRRWLNKWSLGNNPLLLAVKTCAVDMLILLCQTHKRLGISVEETDCNRVYPLHWAAFYKSTAMLDALIDAGAKPSNGCPFWVTSTRFKTTYDVLNLDIKAQFSSIRDLLYEPERRGFGHHTDLLIAEENPAFRNLDPFGGYLFKDVFFHIDRICVNLGLVRQEEFSTKYCSSASYYKDCIIKGLSPFLRYLEQQQRKLEHDYLLKESINWNHIESLILTKVIQLVIHKKKQEKCSNEEMRALINALLYQGVEVLWDEIEMSVRLELREQFPWAFSEEDSSLLTNVLAVAKTIKLNETDFYRCLSEVESLQACHQVGFFVASRQGDVSVQPIVSPSMI